MPAPLRKKRKDGSGYTRVVEIENRLRQLEACTHDEMLRLASLPRTHPDRLPDECLVHVVRGSKSDNSPRRFERLFATLMERAASLLPRAEVGATNSLMAMRIREHVLDAIVTMLVEDRAGYVERLDYFEIRFESAVARLRADARRPARREALRTVSLHGTEDGEDLAPEVEKAIAGAALFEIEKNNDPDYRHRLDAAIDTLTQEQIRIIEMIRRGMIIHSDTDPNAITIAKTLGKAEKTIRTHRDKAYAAIREHFVKHGS